MIGPLRKFVTLGDAAMRLPQKPKFKRADKGTPSDSLRQFITARLGSHLLEEGNKSNLDVPGE